VILCILVLSAFLNVRLFFGGFKGGRPECEFDSLGFLKTIYLPLVFLA
jgi:hypothetical protein